MSAIYPVTLPKWGLEMAEGTIAAWHVAEGADIEKGADLVDIETEKIVNTLDLDRGGKVRRLLAGPGDVRPVGALIAVLAPASVSDKDVDAFIAAYRPLDASFEPGERDSGPPQPEPAPAAKVGPPASVQPEAAPGPVAGAEVAAVPEEELRRRNEAAHATPVARRVANQRGVDLSTVQGTGRGGRISQDDVEKASVAPAAAAVAAASPGAETQRSPEERKAANDAVHASPIARKIANRIGVDLSGIAGTGRRGRVSLADLEKAAALRGIAMPLSPGDAAPAPIQPRTPPPAAAPSPAATPVAPGNDVVPFSSLRRSIAQTLVRAKQTIPHFYTTVDIEADALLALRQQVNASPAFDTKVSLNDFMLRASALALAKHPEVNVHVSEEGIRPFDTADIAVAVAIEGGLVTPVIRDVAARSVVDIAKAAAVLAEKARSRTLGGDDLKGATFTVSNLGMFGVREFDAIINPPQAAILAVGGLRREAREKDGGVVFVSVLSVTLSADHRAVDGALAARFLGTLRDLIEAPLSILM